jgi:hypothetical protein
MKLLSRLVWLAVGTAASMSCLAAPGVLDRVMAGGKLVIAHRESSVPFSYVNEKTGQAHRLRGGYVPASGRDGAPPDRQKGHGRDVSAGHPGQSRQRHCRRARRIWSAAQPPTMPSGARRWLSPFRTSSRARACWCGPTARSRASRISPARSWFPPREPRPLQGGGAGQRERLMGHEHRGSARPCPGGGNGREGRSRRLCDGRRAAVRPGCGAARPQGT